mgnify:CR=1 FL=1|tara:strand:- start:16755 stop:17246 length:492 start_codon:yes stop_codon:yes gene_type:complete
MRLNELREKAAKLNIEITPVRDDSGWGYWLEGTGYEDNNFCTSYDEIEEKLNNPLIVENKATMNRGNIRAWRQTKNCPHQTANRRYDITYMDIFSKAPSVRIDWNEKGAKKVSDTARGATIDLVNKSMTELFGADWMDEKFYNFVWKIDATGITITAKYLGDS